jgi:hypothetical protein
VKKLINEWRKFLNENSDEIPYEEIKNIIDDEANDLNKFIRGQGAQIATPNNLSVAGDFYVIGRPEDFEHIKGRHLEGEEFTPGSKFLPNIDFRDAIISLVSKNSPNDIKDPSRVKWLNLPAGMTIGQEKVKKGNPSQVSTLPTHTSVSEFRNTKVIPMVQKQGAKVTTEEGAQLARQGASFDEIPDWSPESKSKAYQVERVAVGSGPGKKTDKLSFIAGLIGTTADGKNIISPITAFPGGDLVGSDGEPITDRNKLAAAGYYFVR